MIFTTQLELNITIKDINAIYSTDYEPMLIDHARLMYERTCRDGQYVKSIDKLVKRSLPNLIKRDLTAKVRVYIVVEATVIRYDQYDIISGMTISKIIPAGKIGNFDMIECRNDHVAALMKIQKGVEQFKVGDKIPIRVGQSMYKIGNGHILVNGYPFLPYVPDAISYSIGTLTATDKEYYNTMAVPLIKREIARKEKLNNTTWDKFAKMIHPYKKESASSGIDILDVDNISNNQYEIDYHSNLSNLKILKVGAKSNKVGSTPVIADSSKYVLTRIAFQFVKYLEAVNDLAEEYCTDDSFKQVDYIWELYEKNKL